MKNPKWQPCDGRIMVKILMVTIQMNLCCLLHVSLGFGTNSPELLLNFLPLAYHHSHFLATTWISRLFPHPHSWDLHTFYSWTVFGLDFISFCNCILQSWVKSYGVAELST